MIEPEGTACECYEADEFDHRTGHYTREVKCDACRDVDSEPLFDDFDE